MVARHAEADPADQTNDNTDGRSTQRGGISAGTWILFAVGIGLLVAAAVSLTHLSDWSDRWGQVPTFLVFFILMSLAGRWFWGGIDAIIRQVKDK